MLRFDAVPELVKARLEQLTPLLGSQGFALGGGTSLALRFGHRISVDLDFFTQREFSPEDLFAGSGLDEATIVGNFRNTLRMDAEGVKLEFLRHAYPLLSPIESLDGIPLLSVADVAAMKLNAIANRGSKKDFFDVAELMEHHKLEEMLEFFSNKYRSSDPFTVIRSLAWFDDAEADPDPVSLRGCNWEDVKNAVNAALARLA